MGKLLPGMEGRIVEEGEFLARGPLVMKGYLKEPAKTADAIDVDGWLHTGDVMAMDEVYLKIVDRKKQLITNAASKRMSPATIETTIKAACPLIGGWPQSATAALQPRAGRSGRRGRDGEA